MEVVYIPMLLKRHADFVMLGGTLVHDEGGGKIITSTHIMVIIC